MKNPPVEIQEMHTFVSTEFFIWFLTILTLIFSVGWFIFDSRILIRVFKDNSSSEDYNRHDQIFGSIIGIAICFVGALGVLMYHKIL